MNYKDEVIKMAANDKKTRRYSALKKLLLNDAAPAILGTTGI